MTPKLTCYIIDDEHLAQEILEEYISKVPFLELKGVFMSPLEAAVQIDKDKPDLLFLDINMPDLDGLSFIPMLNPKPMIILTTAYDRYALEAFDLEVKDYLVKPFPFERFYKGVVRLYRDKIKSPGTTIEVHAEIPQDHNYIFIKAGNRLEKVRMQDILYIEGMKDYLGIQTSSGKIMTLMSFTSMEELLPAGQFARVHRSFIVSIEKIDHIERNRIKINDKSIPVSDSYRDGFYGKLKSGGI